MSEEKAIRNDSKPVTRESFSSFLRGIGLSEGENVLVHSSLSSLGWVCGGAETVILALLDVVGNHGTVMVPTHTAGNSNPANWQNPPVPRDWWQPIRDNMPGFDPLRTPTRDMGVIAELFRTWPGAMRSNHPVGSFAAIGKRAAYLVSEHPLAEEFGETSPLARLYELDGLVLLLGVGHIRNTSLHLAEYRSHFPTRRFVDEGCAVLEGGVRRWVEFKMLGLETDDFEQLGVEIDRASGALIGRSTNPPARLLRQRAMVDFATEWMNSNRK
jgi:aminoglycoside 3-N-acetyltransferase